MTSNIGTDRIKHGSEHPSMHMNRKHAPCRAFLRGFIFQLNCCFSYRRYLFCSAGKPCFGMLKLSRSCFSPPNLRSHLDGVYRYTQSYDNVKVCLMREIKNDDHPSSLSWYHVVAYLQTKPTMVGSTKKKSKRYVSKLKIWGTTDLNLGLLLFFFSPPILGYHILTHPILIHPQTRR